MVEHNTKAQSCALIASIPFLIIVALITVLFINNRPPQIHIPAQRLPKNNGYDDFRRACGMMGKIQHFGPYSVDRPISSWTLAEYRAFAKDNAPIFPLIKSGLAKQCVMPRGDPSDFIGDSPELREMGRTLCGESKYYEVMGDYERAVNYRLDCLEFGVSFACGRGIAPNLTGSAVEQMALKDLYPLIYKLNAAQLAHAAKRMEEIQRKRISYSDIIIAEGNDMSLLLAKMYSAGETDSLLNPISWVRNSASGKMNHTDEIWYNARYAFVNKTSAIVQIANYCKAVAKEQRKPYTGKSRIPIPQNALAKMPNVPSDAEIILGCRVNFEYRILHANFLQTEIALRRYRFDFGCYPTDLADLLPTYLQKIPIDPFGRGKPLKYKPLNGGKSFLLYSLGPDLKDNGGRPGRWSGAGTHGDLVAGKL